MRTEKGRVVYNRKIHFFTAKDLERILGKNPEEFDLTEIIDIVLKVFHNVMDFLPFAPAQIANAVVYAIELVYSVATGKKNFLLEGNPHLKMKDGEGSIEARTRKEVIGATLIYLQKLQNELTREYLEL
jgi:hypothetical protein